MERTHFRRLTFIAVYSGIHAPPPLHFSCPVQQYIEEITEGADKQLKIELGLAEIMEKWAAEAFVFSEWKGRGINVLKSTGTIVEELEEAQVCFSSCVRVFRRSFEDEYSVS